jgi:glycosyltransferase involved in cell wall biosynthesis
MSNPMVSILMPVFNEEKYISEAIKSILSQTYSNLEVIIIDDGSTDDTVKIVQKYLNDTIRLYQPGKIGKVAAFNLAFSKSKGDFICFFAGDDTLPEDSIEKRLYPIVNIIKDSAISFCKIKTFSEIKKFNGIVMPKSNKGNLSGGAMMFNRKFTEKTFPIPEVLGNEDMWQVQHALYFLDVVVEHIPTIGSNFRIHLNNSSSKTDSFSKKTEGMHKRFIVYRVFLDRYRDKLNENQILELSDQAKAEDLRYNNKWLSILGLKNLRFKEKIRFLMHSNSFFYMIRIKLFSFFSGRGR